MYVYTFIPTHVPQVYTVGIGDVYLPELLFIASDPDPLHVFLLDSYNDAPSFVDFLSFTTCDSESVYMYMYMHATRHMYTQILYACVLHVYAYDLFAVRK